MAITEDVTLPDGTTLRAYDTGADDATSLALVWFHGSPQTGALLDPLLVAAAERNIRLLSYGRPSYRGSSPRPGRDVASAAADAAAVADAFGVERFAVMGASGGGPHALACAALLPDRVTGVVCVASPAPYTDEFEWFAGMADEGALRAARVSREERERYARTDEFNPESFTPADWDLLAGAWSSLNSDVGAASEDGDDGLIDDDVAFASAWGFELGQVTAPVLVVQGGRDRIVPPEHANFLLRSIRRAELWLRPQDGHVSILEACPFSMDWLLANTER